MNYTNKGRIRGTKRADRKTKYGNPITNGVAPMNAYQPALPAVTPPALPQPAKKASTTPSSQPKYAPLTNEMTVYGAKKYRTPISKDEFTGKQGSPFEAIIFDIDGTLQSWGAGAEKKILKWAEKHNKAGRTFVVITARGESMYTTSFNWLMHNFPYPFIGPFVRADDDPRYASEFKRELAQGFEDTGLFKIMGAADDNQYVINMWKQWAKDHFDKPEDFDLFEAKYETYSDWRSDLPSKEGKPYTYAGGYGYGSEYYQNNEWDSVKKAYVARGTATPSHWNPDLRAQEADDAKPGYHWVPGNYKDGNNTPAHWEIGDAPEAKHRAAGTTRWEKNDEEAETGKIVYLESDPRWGAYFAARDKSGAYTGVDRTIIPVTDDDLVDEINALLDDEYEENGYTISRATLKAMVAATYKYSSAELDDMEDIELRELAGITDDEHRNALYDAIKDHFNHKFFDDELANLNTDQLESLLELEGPDAEQLVDDMWYAVRGHGDEHYFTSPLPTNLAEQYRLDLENEVYAAYDDVSEADVKAYKLETLEFLADAGNQLSLKRERDSQQPQTEPMDVAEILGEFADEPNLATTELIRQAQAQEGHVA